MKIKKMLLELVMRIIASFPPYKVICANLVMRDEPSSPIDAVLFFGRVPGDQTRELFEKAVDLSKSGATILINGIEDPKFGHTKTEWTEKLTGMGAKNVNAFPASQSTSEEAKAMIAYCKKEGWRRVTILAQPHQLVRCMRALIYAINKEKYWMKIYCSAPSCDFFAPTAGSQNMFPAPRWKHVAIESSLLQNIVGNLCSYKEMIRYYKDRDY